MAKKHPSIDPELDKIIEHYGSDKVLSNYNLGYAKAFKDIRNEVTNVLEIGVGSTASNTTPFSFKGNTAHYPEYKPGGSLRAWREYFPNATIHGVDIQEDCRIDEDRIKTFIFRSMELHECKKHLYDFKYDIIIDDGDHSAISQLITFKNLAPLLKKGGLYCIEDIGGYQGYPEPDGTWYKPELFVEFNDELQKTMKKYGLSQNHKISRPFTIS